MERETLIKFLSGIAIVVFIIFIRTADLESIIIGIFIFFILAIIFIQEVRALVFGLAAIASFFAMIASIIHFQILGALGFMILCIILSLIANI